MTQIDKAIRTGRRVAANTRSAGQTALDGGELMRASGDVIAARMEIMAAGLADPSKIDLTEISLMSSEKVAALSASAIAAGRTLNRMGQTLTQTALDEAAIASRAATAMAGAKSPGAFATAQFNYAMGWWGRAAGQALSLNTQMLKVQADALAPIHKAAVANARRLKK